MLDTNVCIHIMRDRQSEIAARLETLELDDVGVSSIVVAELMYGVEASDRKQANAEALNEFLPYVVVEDWPVEAAPDYGRIRALLRSMGKPIGAMDLLIASHAVYKQATLVTDNLSELRRVPDLAVENWARP